MSRLRDYYSLAKPGIIRGNIIAALAGFFLASRGNVDISLLLSVIIGLSLVIASACVFNNVLDRSIDTRMQRTKKRAVAAARISPRSAVLYAGTLGLAGALVLGLFTTTDALVYAFIAHILYVIAYGYTKRKSPLGTPVGALPGALPPVIGYVAVLGSVDIVAIGLFLILFVWQMPHFYAIAIFRRDDYIAAGIPVLSAVKSVEHVKKRIAHYVMFLLPLILWFGIVAELSAMYFVLTVVAVLFWQYVGFVNRNETDIQWARKMFGTSLVVLLVICTSISVDASFI